MKLILFFKKPFRWAIMFSMILVGFFAFAAIDTFFIPKTLVALKNQTPTTITAVTPISITNSAIVTENSYVDENIKINIETVRAYDTTLYVADIQVSDISYLKTALAKSTYGRNIKETTSDIASENNAIFAVNGDYYGFRDTGYVLKNSILYRDTSSGRDDLVIDSNGNFSIINESNVLASSLASSNISQVFSFGPALVENSKILVDTNSEVSQSKTSNPRTAIGQVSELHYIIVVSDGRTTNSTGLSLLQLAEQFESRGCTIAYNLDGGGSSTMYFNGKVINNPTDGKSIKERAVSDIVYIG